MVTCSSSLTHSTFQLTGNGVATRAAPSAAPSSSVRYNGEYMLHIEYPSPSGSNFHCGSPSQPRAAPYNPRQLYLPADSYHHGMRSR